MDGPTVKPYRLLDTPFSVDRNVQLPIAEGSLVNAVLTMTHKSNGLGVALLNSPALLLFTCAHYAQQHSEPPSSELELLEWFRVKGLDLIENGLVECGGSNVPKWHLRFLDAATVLPSKGGNKRLRNQLVEPVLMLPKVGLKSAKAWLKRAVGKALTPRNLAASSLKLVGDESQTSMVETVFDLVRRDWESRIEFEVRLRDEKLSAMKELAYGASHEINNPLANIATRAQVLIANESNPERRRKLAVIHEQAMRAHEMISDMMLFAHPPKSKFELIDVYDWIKQVVLEMKNEIRAGDAMVDIRRYPNVDKAWVDPTQFAVLLKALIKNSLESLATGLPDHSRRIIVRLWADSEQSLSVSVTDQGPGVSDAAAKHLFDPFYSGREAGRGLGFGLSKAWRIAQLHQGNLVWNQDFEEGTRFTFRFPKVQTGCSRIDKASAA